MLNSFYGEYIKNRNKNDQLMKIKQPTIKPIVKNGHLVRNNKYSINPDPKSQPIVRNGHLITNKSIIDTKPEAHTISKTSSNPYEKLFGFNFDKYKMEHKLPNAYRYSGLLGESDLNLAMDVAETENYIVDGELDKAFEIGNKDKTSEFYKRFKENFSRKVAINKGQLDVYEAFTPEQKQEVVESLEKLRLSHTAKNRTMKKIKERNGVPIKRTIPVKSAVRRPVRDEDDRGEITGFFGPKSRLIGEGFGETKEETKGESGE